MFSRIVNRIPVKSHYRRTFTTENPLTRITLENGIKTITMCDQKTRNSLSLEMMGNLIENIQENSSDINLRVIVLTAERSSNIFSAGHNLKQLTPGKGAEAHEKVFELASDLMGAILDSPVPIIAKIDGLAAAAGCQLVSQCDLAFCTKRSAFSTPGVNFGIFCSTPGVALARSVKKSTAMKMLLTGEPISSSEALSSGLICKVCEDSDDLDAEISKICDSIKGKSRAVVELGRKFYYKQIEENLKTAYKLGGSKMVENLQLSDGKEGISSFVEKRKAVWSHSSEKL